MRIIKIAVSASLFMCAISAMAIDIPSDEELMRQGRAEVGDVLQKMDTQQRLQPMTAPTATPMDDTHLSPLAKKLMQETMDTKLPTSGRKTGQIDILVFVSFSMPNELLAQYSKQAKEAGAVMVLRGLVDNSIAKTQARALKVNAEIAPWEINPGSFRKFKIDKVPAIVLVDDDKAIADESGCAQPVSYLRIDGDISIRQALNTMKWRGDGNLAKLAEQKLKSIEGN